MLALSAKSNFFTRAQRQIEILRKAGDYKCLKSPGLPPPAKKSGPFGGRSCRLQQHHRLAPTPSHDRVAPVAPATARAWMCLRAGSLEVRVFCAFAHRLVARRVGRSIEGFGFGGHGVHSGTGNHLPLSRLARLSLSCRADGTAWRLRKGQAWPLRLGLASRVDSFPAP